MPRAISSASAKDTPVTHDNDKPTPTEPPAQDTALSLLAMATPAFRFSFLSAGFHRAIWPTRRKKPANRGGRAEATANVDELKEGLDPATVPSDGIGAEPDPEHVDADG